MLLKSLTSSKRINPVLDLYVDFIFTDTSVKLYIYRMLCKSMSVVIESASFQSIHAYTTQASTII